MILIERSPTANKVGQDITMGTLLVSTEMHRDDVRAALSLLSYTLDKRGETHDLDKLNKLPEFHVAFKDGFKDGKWFDTHMKNSRHHLSYCTGVPEDVNLLDVLEYIADCVMAGRARGTELRPVIIDAEVLARAFGNTVDMLNSQVLVQEPPTQEEPKGE